MIDTLSYALGRTQESNTTIFRQWFDANFSKWSSERKTGLLLDRSHLQAFPSGQCGFGTWVSD